MEKKTEFSLESRMPKMSLYIAEMLKNNKPRKFVESVEIQVLRKKHWNYDNRPSIRLIKLPYPRRYNNNICLIGDAEHIEEAKNMQNSIENVNFKIFVFDMEYLKRFEKRKRRIMNWAKQFDCIVCSEGLYKVIFKITGPALVQTQKFYETVGHTKTLSSYFQDLICTVRFKIIRYEQNISTVIGNIKLSAAQIEENLKTYMKIFIENFPLRWAQIVSVHIKTSMGKPYKLY